MNQNYSPLNLPVFTTTEHYLGRVVDVELNNTGETVVNYCVLPPFSVMRLWRKCLLISAQQVVSFNKERLVVRGSEIKLPNTIKTELTTELPVG